MSGADASVGSVLVTPSRVPPIPTPASSPSPPPFIDGSSTHSALPFVSKGLQFIFRRLQPTDTADITELARHTYEGKDFIQKDFVTWMSSDDEHTLPVAIVYCGPVAGADESAGAVKAADGDTNVAAERSQYVNRVVSIEVCLFLDGGSTSWLYALRVHPTFRGLSLSSYLHSYMIAASQQRPAVRRLREATDATNQVSLHLGAKHQLRPTFASSYCWVNREQHDSRLSWVERMLVKRGVRLADVQLRDETTNGTGWLSRGTGSDLMKLHAAQSTHAAFQFLCQYWVCYEFTDENVRMLIEDKGHEVLVSHSSTTPTTNTTADVQAVSLTQFRSDFTSNIQSFTIYATDATHCLLHLHHAIQRQAPHRHDAEQYARSMFFVPTFFEQAVNEDATEPQDAWKADMSLVLLERHIEHGGQIH